ncbi:hypothetical protein TorRG33x02_327830 [Trema orientale]|uniref:Transmembrane protein n=1 Tax=Trema orientale TaxID=63057 RepID=A0A2P5BAI0_TREOI|nr:hypothetical protein TorRG33x02_327830 [Trema orientale]
MNKLVGHVIPGFSFFIVGLWHLLNHIKLQVVDPNSYTALPWFPTSKSKYLEPLLAMGFCFLPLLKELFSFLRRHQVQIFNMNHDHLQVIEHNSIYFALFINSAFAVILDLARVRARYGLTLFLTAVAYAHGLFLIHFHSSKYTTHMGPEGQYHLLLQLLLVVCLATILLGIALPKSFMVSFVRSLSICFQGVWLVFMGIMLWTPGLLPEGCILKKDVVICSGEEALHRANSFINLQFGWFLIGIAIFGVSLYLVLDKIYGQNQEEYFPLEMREEEDFYNAEYSQKKSKA